MYYAEWSFLGTCDTQLYINKCVRLYEFTMSVYMAFIESHAKNATANN